MPLVHLGAMIPDITRPPTAPQAVARALRRRCPRCGSPGIFRSWSQLHDRCPGCDRHFEREEGFFLGAYTLNLGATQVVLLATLAIGVMMTAPDIPAVLLGSVASAAAVITAVAFYPWSKSLWLAVDVLMHPHPD